MTHAQAISQLLWHCRYEDGSSPQVGKHSQPLNAHTGLQIAIEQRWNELRA